MRIILSMLLLTIATQAAAEGTRVEFSSVYTYLARDCHWAHPADDLQEGQDNALQCQGAGPYLAYIYFSAQSALLSVQRTDDPDNFVLHPAVDGIDDRNGVVEWRLANGLPFAIIVRSKMFAPPEDGGALLTETLEIRGLEKHSDLRKSVDARTTPSANEAARVLADEAY